MRLLDRGPTFDHGSARSHPSFFRWPTQACLQRASRVKNFLLILLINRLPGRAVAGRQSVLRLYPQKAHLRAPVLFELYCCVFGMAAFSGMTGRRIVWWSVVLLLLLAAESRAAEPRRVLLLHAFGHAYSPWSDMAASFRAEIIKRSPRPIDLYEVSLDTARVQDSKDDVPFIEYIKALLSGRSPDLIVPVGAPAAFFLQRNRAHLFPTTPMLILGADVRRIPGATRTEYDTGVLLDLDLPAYVTNILQLRPQTTDIAVVVGKSPVERYWASELRRAFQQFTG